MWEVWRELIAGSNEYRSVQHCAGSCGRIGWASRTPARLAGRQGSSIVCASVQSCALVCRPCCCRSVASAWSVRIAVIVTTVVLVKVINSMDERQSGVVLIKCKYLCTRSSERRPGYTTVWIIEGYNTSVGTGLPHLKEISFVCVCVCRDCVMLHNPILEDVVFVEKYASLCYLLLVLCAVSKVRSADLRRAVTGTFAILLLWNVSAVAVPFLLWCRGVSDTIFIWNNDVCDLVVLNVGGF
jgi:hypothetical protein